MPLSGNFKGICSLSYEDHIQELTERTKDFEIPIKCLILPGPLCSCMSTTEKTAGTDMELLHVHIHERG